VCWCRVRIRFSVIHSLYEDVFAQFENTEGGMEDTDDDAPPQVCVDILMHVAVMYVGQQFSVLYF